MALSWASEPSWFQVPTGGCLTKCWADPDTAHSLWYLLSLLEVAGKVFVLIVLDRKSSPSTSLEPSCPLELPVSALELKVITSRVSFCSRQVPF